jgi:hypothetical protein
MSLTTYDEVRPWARAIKEQVLARRMPKWHAARGFGSFKNDPTLTPIEIGMIVSWVDGGLPFSISSPRVAAAVSPTVAGSSAIPGRASSPSTPVASAFRRKVGIPSVRIPAGKNEAVAQMPAQWVSGWSFEPGDPLITEAVIRSDSGVIGNWVAGDTDVRLPAGSAVRVSGRVQVDLRRRRATDYEQSFKARRSVLRFTTREEPPARRVWTELVSCGTPRAARSVELLAVRPLLDDQGAARVWLERAGAPKTIVGWFRDFDPNFPRTYWLARPVDLPIEARLQADAPCQLQLTLISPR